MKILIMVLSSMKPPFDKLYQIQKETWDSIKEDNVETFYYFGNDWELMHVPFRDALKEVWDRDWDVIYRTNSSSYVNKKLLVDFLKGRDTEKLWIGDEIGNNSGASFIVSRDLAQILINQIPDNTQPYEDVLISDILKQNGYKIQVGERCWYNHDNSSYFDCYHIRCKNICIRSDVNGTSDNRESDINAMKHIFLNIKNKKSLSKEDYCLDSNVSIFYQEIGYQMPK
jgi:hypothetical protein